MIEFQDVESAFGDRPVLKGLSLHVEKGESFVLMGPSGSGKSTTLLHMVGVYRALRGRVLVQGVDVGRAGPEELRMLRRNIGFLFQGAALLNWLDVYDNVALPLREAQDLPETEVRSRVEEALSHVRLWQDRTKYPSELSGGMRKRAGLARALAIQPQILLYDEPTGGLDPAMSSSIENLIVDLKNRLGVTSVVVTHDVLCAAHVADRIAVLADGRIQAEGDRRLLESTDPVILEFLGRPVGAGGTR